MVWEIFEFLFACLLTFFSWRTFKNEGYKNNKTRIGIGSLAATASIMLFGAVLLEIVMNR